MPSKNSIQTPRVCPVCGTEFRAYPSDPQKFCSISCGLRGRWLGVTAESFFWQQVEKTESCWLWRGPVHYSGYGVFLFDHRRYQAHRFSWQLAHGEIPDGLHVLHHCDVRACCRPDHLWLGTDLDNMRDRDEKGRGASHRGEKNGRAKLTDDQAREIRAARGVKGTDLARKYGVSPTRIARIRNGKEWRHL